MHKYMYAHYNAHVHTLYAYTNISLFILQMHIVHMYMCMCRMKSVYTIDP